jgi:hypothetical protein
MVKMSWGCGLVRLIMLLMSSSTSPSLTVSYGSSGGKMVGKMEGAIDGLYNKEGSMDRNHEVMSASDLDNKCSISDGASPLHGFYRY